MIWNDKGMVRSREQMTAILGTQFHLERVMYLKNSIGYCLKEGKVLTNTVTNLPHFIQELNKYIQYSQCTDWLFYFWMNYDDDVTQSRAEIDNVWDMHAFNHSHPPYSS